MPYRSYEFLYDMQMNVIELQREIFWSFVCLMRTVVKLSGKVKIRPVRWWYATILTGNSCRTTRWEAFITSTDNELVKSSNKSKVLKWELFPIRWENFHRETNLSQIQIFFNPTVFRYDFFLSVTDFNIHLSISGPTFFWMFIIVLVLLFMLVWC